MIMDKERLNELLDSIYELEGLVHLALTRDDNPERLPELIARKGEELARHAASVAEATAQSSNDCRQEAAPAQVIMPEEPIDEQPLYVVDKEETEDAVAESPSPIEEDMQSVVETVFDALPEALPGALPDDEPDVSPDDEPEPSELKSLSREPRGKLVFSINDRYRFKRELFNNSDTDFNNTLALVASMENYDEAEDYFLGELAWDPKRGDVIDFLEILKRYFKE